MTTDSPTTQHENASSGATPWFATFSFLDFGGTISSSQLRRFVAPLVNLWRRTFPRRT